MSEKNCVKKAITKNPLMVLFLGACPAMAATATVMGGFGMGLAVLAVMVLSNLVLSLLKKVMPAQAMIPVCVIVSAGFVSAAQMLMNAFMPEVYEMIGLYVAVVAVNLVVFSEAEAAADSSVGTAVLQAVITGLSFTAILLVMGAIRELLGSASIAGKEVAFLANYRIPLLATAPGGYLVASIVTALLSKVNAPCCGSEGCDCVTCKAIGMGECKCECEDKEVQA